MKLRANEGRATPSPAFLSNQRKLVQEVAGGGAVRAAGREGDKSVRRNRLSSFLAGIPKVRVVTGDVPADESDDGTANVQREVNADLHDNARGPGKPRW